jgi:hypothetical protein
MTPFEHQQKLKSQIFGSYNNVGTTIKKSEENKPIEGTDVNSEKKEAPESVKKEEDKEEGENKETEQK